MARRPKLTPELTSQLADLVAKTNMPWKVAAEIGGVADRTLGYWLERGERAILAETNDPGPCPTCGADGEAPCESSKGKAAAHPHAGRVLAVGPGDEPYVLLVRALKDAEARAHAANLADIQKAGRGGGKTTKTTEEFDAFGILVKRTVVTDTVNASWQASAWLLERRYPETYARRTVTEITGDGGVTAPAPTTDELIAMRDEVAERRGRRSA